MNFTQKGKDNNITEERLLEFQVELFRIIKEILTPEIPFVENTNLPF